MDGRQQEKRFFTLEEANAYVPRLEEWLLQMRELRHRMRALQDEIAPVIENVQLNSGSRAASDFAVCLHRLQALTTRIRDEGIFLRDVETGLVDFPAVRANREVFLCWKSGEPTVQFWHELDTGFAGRKRLGDLDEDDLRAAKAESEEV